VQEIDLFDFIAGQVQELALADGDDLQMGLEQSVISRPQRGQETLPVAQERQGPHVEHAGAAVHDLSEEQAIHFGEVVAEMWRSDTTSACRMAGEPGKAVQVSWFTRSTGPLTEARLIAGGVRPHDARTRARARSCLKTGDSNLFSSVKVWMGAGNLDVCLA
jgi:hypothetical protein